MHLQRIDQQLAHLRGELERLDHTGQPLAPIIAKIGSLENEREGLAAGMDILSTPRWRRVCEQLVDDLLSQ